MAKSAQDGLPVEALERLDAGRWRGRVRLPDRIHPITILVFAWGAGYRGVSARCPHEGQDLSACPLAAGGYLACPRHGERVALTGPASFALKRIDAGFVLPWPPEAAR